MQEVAAIRKDGFPEFFGPADDYSTAAREQACREAWAFLNAHSLFRVGKVGSFSRCITISLIPSYLVAEEIQKYDHDPIGHCWKVECGPPMEMGMFSWQTGCYERCYLSVIDERLTAIDTTFEEAIIKLAGEVLIHYGAK